ncbi:MAG: DegT/DnrJ/EryC1/StrS family aminotransferase [Desulfosarcina sp.]|nr:DegT/DnrJ/EryC1/StrS family aminotransferase [Desulfobacterales bacterium]
MKILINTDLLLELANRYQGVKDDDFLKRIINSPKLSLWVSASSVQTAMNDILKGTAPLGVDAFYQFIRDHFTIIPLRRSILEDSFQQEGRDLATRINIASAISFKLDSILTRDKSNFLDVDIPVLTPEEFIKKGHMTKMEAVKGVPFIDLKAQHNLVYNEIDDRLTDIITNTGFVLGKYVAEFESRFAELQEAKYALGVSSGTDALHVALMALGIGRGDTVVVPVNTFIATAEAVSLTGATPVFMDCDRSNNIDSDKLENFLNRAVDRNERLPAAVIPVHLYGLPAGMERLMELSEKFGFRVVEDSCQAHLASLNGKKVGTFGAFGAFSFYPGKNLGAYGEAGAIITNDENLYEKAKMLRQHGELTRYKHEVIGHNYRMEAIQGAVLSTKLKHLVCWTKKRQKNASFYNELLADVKGIQTPVEPGQGASVYHLYVIETDDREGLQKYLQDNNIATGLHYPLPLHLQKAYASLGYSMGEFPCAEEKSEKILSLPIYPELTAKQIEFVCDKIRQYASGEF